MSSQLALPSSGFSVAHHRTAAGDCRITPRTSFAKVAKRWGPFGLDAFAKEATKLAQVWFGPDSPHGVDGLTADWSGHGSVWWNPPFSLLAKAVSKAQHEMRKGVRSVGWFLNVTETEAFDLCAECSDVVWVRPRVHHPLEPGTECGKPYTVGTSATRVCGKPQGHGKACGPDNSPQRGSVLVVFDPDHYGPTRHWLWNHTTDELKPMGIDPETYAAAVRYFLRLWVRPEFGRIADPDAARVREAILRKTTDSEEDVQRLLQLLAHHERT